MIHTISWDPTSGTLRHNDALQLPHNYVDMPAELVLWIDLDNPTPEEESRILDTFLHVHPLTLEDITKPRRDPEEGPHLPKVEEFADYLFVIVNPLPNEMTSGKPLPPGFRLDKRSRPQLSAILTHRLLITHHYAPLPCIIEGQMHLERHVDNLRRGPDYLFHLILDGIVDDYAPVVEQVGEQLDLIESHMFHRPTPRLLERLLRIKRRVSYMRKTLILEREVLARLMRGEFALVEDREIVYYRNVYDHLVRYTELIESGREMVSDLMQSHLSVTSNRLNEVMKVLTMISVMGLLCSVIAGIYGMNFKHMPELEWPNGYYFALGLMGTAVSVSLTVFKWKKWF